MTCVSQTTTVSNLRDRVPSLGLRINLRKIQARSISQVKESWTNWRLHRMYLSQFELTFPITDVRIKIHLPRTIWKNSRDDDEIRYATIRSFRSRTRSLRSFPRHRTLYVEWPRVNSPRWFSEVKTRRIEPVPSNPANWTRDREC